MKDPRRDILEKDPRKTQKEPERKKERRTNLNSIIHQY
jgi:hypothetical protein